MRRSERSLVRSSEKVIEAQDLPPVPRATRMKESHAQARRGWAVAAVVAGAVLLTWLLMENARWHRLAEHGVTTEGRVTGRRVTTGKSPANLLTVEFLGARRRREETFSVSNALYESHPYGATIPMVVDPEDATNSGLLRFSPAAANRRLLLWGLGWTAGGLLVLLSFWSDAKSVAGQRRVLAEWNLGAMTVDGVLPGEARVTGLFLSGHFTDDQGKERTILRLHLPTGFQARETVPILYGDAQNEIVALTSLDKVEIA